MEVNNKVQPPEFHQSILKRTYIFGNILSYTSLILILTDTSSYFCSKVFIVLFQIRKNITENLGTLETLDYHQKNRGI